MKSETKAPAAITPPREVQAILDELNADPPAETVPERRSAFAKLCSFSGATAPAQIFDDTFTARDGAKISVRSYGSGTPRLLYFHGGGYVAGDLETHHAALTQISQAWPGTVTHVDYRRAPEHRFPQALYDAQDALEHFAEKEIFVGGDSAGGNLAAALSLTHRNLIAGQILLYPTLDAQFSGESWRQMPKGFIASAEDARKFNLLSARDERDFVDPLFSPVHARDLADLPPAWFFVGECDPARSDSELYARKLNASGVPALVRIFPGMIHGFVTMAGRLEPSRRLHKAIGAIATNKN